MPSRHAGGSGGNSASRNGSGFSGLALIPPGFRGCSARAAIVPRDNQGATAGDMLAAVSLDVRRLRLTPKMLRELRLALLAQTFTSELELVEERYANGDVVVRLGQPGKPQDGEIVLGHRSEAEQAEEHAGLLFDTA